MNFFCAIIGPMAKIAIIEDDQAVAQMYRMKFESDGHEVATAANGRLGTYRVNEARCYSTRYYDAGHARR